MTLSVYKHIVGLLMLTLLLTSLTGCSDNNKINALGAKESQPLIVGIMPDLDSIPFVIAKDQGYLPVNVKLEIFKSPMDRDSAMLSGNLDGAISDMLAVVIARNGDFDAYATSKTNGRYGVLSGSGSGISSAGQLEGKQLGLSLNTIIEYVADRVIIESGGQPEDVSKLSVPKIPARLELLDSGQLDAIAVPEPYVTAAVTNGAVLLGLSTDYNINPAVMMFTGDAVNNKQSELISLYEAYDMAVEYINNTDKAEYMPIVIDELGLPDSTIEVVLPKYEKMTLPDEYEVTQAVDWLVSKELVDRQYEYKELIREIK